MYIRVAGSAYDRRIPRPGSCSQLCARDNPGFSGSGAALEGIGPHQPAVPRAGIAGGEGIGTTRWVYPSRRLPAGWWYSAGACRPPPGHGTGTGRPGGKINGEGAGSGGRSRVIPGVRPSLTNAGCKYGMGAMTYYRLGLLGYPTDHSLSPRLHQAALAALNIAGRYDLFSIPPTPKGRTEIRTLLERMRRGKLHGLNVTIPHKMMVINYLDELSPTANAIGAVNAILVRGTRLVGENFDCPAFMADVSICMNRA